jgi:omega-6 fatty acid desaturase (delta-12 desaturase)
LRDAVAIACIYKAAVTFDPFINPAQLTLPHPFLYTFARFALFGLFMASLLASFPPVFGS